MAHMIPPVPKEYDEKSDEGAVFRALQKLPDDYYVFHSVRGTVVENDVVYERELDFVVANAKKVFFVLKRRMEVILGLMVATGDTPEEILCIMRGHIIKYQQLRG